MGIAEEGKVVREKVAEVMVAMVMAGKEKGAREREA